LLHALGTALVVDEVPEKADAIVLPEWAGRAGAIEAADLVHAGISDRVVVVPAPREAPDFELTRRGVRDPSDAERLVQILEALGVVRIEQLSEAANGTESEGRLLSMFCKERDFHAIVVVSTRDHSRRVRRVLRRSMEEAGVRTIIRVKSARFSPFDAGRWWETRGGTRTEIEELEKLVLDVARHPVS
jgi:hypothetical protein